MTAALVGGLLAASAVVTAPVGPVAAAGGVYAGWTVTGANPAWSGSMTVAATGFPAATFTTNSNTPSVATSATLGVGTPFGAEFGSSSGQQYLSFRAAAGQRPSTTTFTVDSPTPASGWGFALGDIDAEAITLEAIGPDGPLTAAELGYQSSFNYASGSDTPVWNPATATLSGNVLDTNGAAGWFMPTAPITSLTLTFTTLSGFPIAQMWVAATTSTISGTVTDVSSGSPVPSGGHTIGFYDENDQLLATTTSAVDGTYTSPALVAAVYAVKIVPAVGFAVIGSAAESVDTSDGDVTGVNFTVAVPPAPTTTTVTGPSEAAVGVAATITGHVTVSTSATPPITFTGAVAVSGLGSGCTDTALTAVAGEPYQFEFECEITPTEPGAFLITAEYIDTASPVDFGSSADSSVIDVDGDAIPTTTTITAIAPNPSVVGETYTVSGTVAVAADAPAGELPGAVTVTGDGDGCVDTALVATTDELYAFACSILPPAVGTVTLTATYADPTDHFGPSTDTAVQRIITPPPPPPPPSPPPPPPVVIVDRVAGTDRVATAVAVARRYFAAGAPIVYVATERDFADALVAGPPAGLDDAPVLLTAPDDLPASVVGEIRRLGPVEIVIVGGTAAVSTRVEDQLGALAPTITRIGGVDRYATAALVARLRIGGRGGAVYIASGTNFPDALSAGVPAARAGAPILLVTRDALPEVTRTEVQHRRASTAVVVGGPDAVGSGVVAGLGGLVPDVERVAGVDRYATSAAVNRLGVGALGGASTVFLVTGADFPDALAAVPAAVVGGGAVLLSRPTCVPPSIGGELRRLAPQRVTLVGGAGALSPAVAALTGCT